MTDLTRAATLSNYLELATRYGLDGPAMMRDAGLPAYSLTQPEMFIAYRQFVTLLERSAQASGQPLFGLELGLLQGIGQFGPLSYLIRNCADVRQALHSFARYYHLHSASGNLALTAVGKHTRLAYQLDLPKGLPRKQALELALGVGVQLMRTLCGPRWQAEQLCLQTSPTEPLARYTQLLGHTPQFNAPENALMFASSWLDCPLTDADPALHRLMHEQLARQDALHHDDVLHRVSELLRSLLPSGDATLELVAEHLAISPRSLQRHLQAESHSFHALLEQVRKDTAERYLRESSLPFTQLASLLGYTEASTFSRAFRRWFGCSPRAWQRQQAGGRD
ncbi:AraC family transcriptional regulator [Jeongeupia wiesaeckerbachi]|uniref:AraC-like transcriptional regulator QhpR n=1 Tax=Jeongeupia wiesaeckerbachi TaxID=3051218 RepID=UPI003D807EE8